MTETIVIQGTTTPALEPVRTAFARNVEEGLEVGAAFAVYKDGEPLASLWYGSADGAGRRPWTEDTICNVWSTTKGMTALTCALCVDRGVLDYDAKVTDYWPEFGAEGKDAVTVGQLLSHQAGVCGLAIESVEEYYDQDRMAERLAAMTPLWKPGSTSGYHAVTYGFLAAELVRRVTGTTLGEYFRTEIAEPFGIDFHIGLPESEEPRVAEMLPSPPLTDEARAKLNDAQRLATGEDIGRTAQNTRAWRAAELPAVNGTGSAAALAKAWSIAAAGGALNGKRLISRAALDAMTAEQILAKDLVLSFPMSWGAGIIRNAAGVLYGPNTAAYGHTGFGGSCAFADPEAGIGVAYTMNRMALNLIGDKRSRRLIAALYESLAS